MKKNRGCLQLIIGFQAEETPFSTSYFKAAKKNLNTYLWWKDYFTKKSSKSSLFNNFILQLLICSASSASTE